MAGRFSITSVKPSGRVAAALAASAALLTVITWVALSFRDRNFGRISQTHGPASSATEPQNWAGLDPAALRPAGVGPAILCDYYEHNTEHAPPRDPSGCMQRREYDYAAPPMPLRLVRSKLAPGSNDVALLHRCELWFARWRDGLPTTDGQIQEFSQLTSKSSLAAPVLLDEGRSFAFLDGDSLAVAWYQSGLSKADSEYRQQTPGDPAARQLLGLLCQTKSLWRLKDYAALETRFTLERRLLPPGSVESRRSGYLYAECLYYQRKTSEAARAILAVKAEHERAGDLGAREQSDLQEMSWVCGLLLYGADRCTEAVPFLQPVAQSDGEHQKPATELLVAALAKSGKHAEAEGWFATYVRRYRPAPRDVVPLVALLERRAGTD